MLHSSMKTLPAALAAVFLLLAYPLHAAPAGDVKAELHALVDQIQTKLKDGKRDEKDFTAELKQFDDILAEHKGEKTEDVAQVLFMKAMLYLQVLDDTDKGAGEIKRLKQDFPDTQQGKAADATLAQIAQMAVKSKLRKSLVEGSIFPDFSEKDLDGKPLSISGFKGKIVLVDFWATWCPPCRASLPGVIAAYQKFHDKGFEIAGISLDADKQQLADFLKEQKMTWPQYFDGLKWENKLAVKYGVESIPSSYLLDKNGIILAKDLTGDDLDAALTKALGAN